MHLLFGSNICASLEFDAFNYFFILSLSQFVMMRCYTTLDINWEYEERRQWFRVDGKRWTDEASEFGTSRLGSDVHSCAGDAPVNKKNTVCSSTSHQGSRLSSRNAGVMSEAVLISALRYPLT